MAEVVARLLRVRGHVQGVFFRDSVRGEAESRGVSGWAVNRPDGSVEVLLEGRPEHVQRLIEYCAHGPPGARVAELDVSAHPPEGCSGFRVR